MPHIPVRRETHQRLVVNWCIRCFGLEHTRNREQHAVRLLEEVLEACQSVRVSPEMAHKLIDYVYGRPVGQVYQELGGIGLTLLAFVDACDQSAAACEAQELMRVLKLPVEHFTTRDQDKNDAGFNVL